MCLCLSVCDIGDFELINNDEIYIKCFEINKILKCVLDKYGIHHD